MSEDKDEPKIFGFSVDTLWKIATLLVGLGVMYEKFQSQFETIHMEMTYHEQERTERAKVHDAEMDRLTKELEGRKKENDEHFKELQMQTGVLQQSLNRLLDMTQGGRSGNDGVQPGWKR